MADLRCLVAVAQTLSITRAAAGLRLGKAAVSKSIARLEAQLGVRLFERTTRRLEPTRACQLARERAEGILGSLDGLEDDVRRDAGEVRGSICIAAPPDLANHLTPTLFSSYLDLLPQMRLVLRLSYELDDLFDPAIDLALRVGPIHDENMVARPVGSLARILVCSPGRAAELRSLEPAALTHHPCLAAREGANEWTLVSGNQVQIVPIHTRMVAGNYTNLLHAATVGLGIAYLPDFVASPCITAGSLVRVFPAWSSAIQTIHLMYRPGRQKTRRVAAMLELIDRNTAWLPAAR